MAARRTSLGRLVAVAVLGAACWLAPTAVRDARAAGPRAAAELVSSTPGVEMRIAPSSPWSAVTPTTPIAAGTTIRTAAAPARLRLPDGTIIGMAPSTTLRVHVPTEISMDPGSNVRVSRCDLAAGEVSLTIPPRAKPVLVMGGTDLFAAFRPGRARAIKNDKGLVAVVDQGSARVATSGRWFSLAHGQYQVLPDRGPVSAAQRVGPVPVLSPCVALAGRGCAIAVVVGKGTARLGARWAPAAPQVRYIVRVARDAAMADVVEQRDLPGNQTSFVTPLLAAGQYWLEVRSVTPDGVAGDAATQAMRVVELQPDPGVFFVGSENLFVLPPGRGVKLASPRGLVVSFGEGHGSPAPAKFELSDKQPSRVFSLALQGSPNNIVPVALEARALEAQINFSPVNACWPRDQIRVTANLVDPNRRVPPGSVRPHLTAIIENKRIDLPVTRSGHDWTANLPQGEGRGPWIVGVEATDDDGVVIGKGVLEVINDADQPSQ